MVEGQDWRNIAVRVISNMMRSGPKTLLYSSPPIIMTKRHDPKRYCTFHLP